MKMQCFVIQNLLYQVLFDLQFNQFDYYETFELLFEYVNERHDFLNNYRTRNYCIDMCL
jgi:hypothetical protein